MRFDLTEEQKLLEKNARDYFTSRYPRAALRGFISKPIFDRARWQEIGGQGWLSALVEEKHGGLGLKLGDIFPLLREAGRALVPLPLWESAVLAPLLLKEQKDEALRGRILAALAEGRAMATVALYEDADAIEPVSVSLRARRDGEAYLLEGEKPIVAFGADADWFVVLARADRGLTLFVVGKDTPGIKTTDVPVTDATYRFAKVEFKAVRVGAGNLIGEEGKSGAQLAVVIPRAQVALCAEMLGGCDRVVEMCVEYAKQRVQFKRPIGSFQAIQHKLADMYTKASIAQGLAYGAVKEVDDGEGNGLVVKVAKAMCNDAYRFIAAEGIQAHGGIAFTWEHDMHLYFKRALRYRNTLGSSPRLFYEVGRALATGESWQ
jgi:alkylation response protein AidB-like acyl-CoA dehydrogenase